jgi:hypothetical protein
MDEENKNSETLRIEISHFTPSIKGKRESSKAKERNSELLNTKDENFSTDNTMKISIERKTNKKSIINVNVNEQSSDQEKIQIKIEKNRKDNNNTISSTDMSPVKKREKISGKNMDSGPPQNLERKDVYGNLVKKGKGKKQRVTFLDINQRNNTNLQNFDKKNKMKLNFIDYVQVASYKAYNVDMSVEKLGGGKAHATCNCKACLIF